MADPIKVCLTNQGADTETPWALDLGPAPGPRGSRRVRLINVPFMHAKPTWGDTIIVSPVEQGFPTWDRGGVPWEQIGTRIEEDGGRWAMIVDYAPHPDAADAFTALAQACAAHEVVCEGAWGPRDGRPGRAYLAVKDELGDTELMRRLREAALPCELVQIHPAPPPPASAKRTARPAAATKPAVKPAAATKPAARPVASRPAEKTAAARPVASRRTASTAATKPAASEPAANTAATNRASSKPAAKPAAAPVTSKRAAAKPAAAAVASKRGAANAAPVASKRGAAKAAPAAPVASKRAAAKAAPAASKRTPAKAAATKGAAAKSSSRRRPRAGR